MMYLGRNYNGYQVQPEGITIQGEVEKALSIISKEQISIVGCGRTDAGVSATIYFFHFDSIRADLNERVYSLNGILDDDIVIESIRHISDDFHARFSATTRGYEYRVYTRPNPFLRNSSFFLPLGQKSLEIDLLQKASSLLLSYKDFNTFCKTHTDVKTTLCDLKRSEWATDDNQLIYYIEANRFLRGMVRLIVGALLNVGLNKLPIEELKNALENTSRLEQNWSVPAHGLYLNKVIYADYPNVK